MPATSPVSTARWTPIMSSSTCGPGRTAVRGPTPRSMTWCCACGSGPGSTSSPINGVTPTRPGCCARAPGWRASRSCSDTPRSPRYLRSPHGRRRPPDAGGSGLVHRPGGPAVTAVRRAPGRGGHGLLEQLMAVVRPEFRAEIYIPALDDPVFAAGQCVVASCDRTAVQRGLCNGHVIRWRQRGRPDLEDFLADSGPPVRGRSPLPSCAADGCHYGRGGGGLCSRHRDRWDRAGRPGLASWEAPELAAPDTRPAECRLPFCSLWAENPAKMFCRSHDDRWQRQGRPDPGRFIIDCELAGTAHVDLRDLVPQLRLEFQYALQCRHDARSRTARPRLVMQAVRQAGRAGVSSLLDRPEQQWRQAAGSQVRAPVLFLLDARDAVESLRDGTGWEVEYAKDVWRLRKLPGIAAPPGRPCPRARLRFDRITQPWLREPGKRWMRLRLASGLSIAAAKAGLDALTCFSQFLALAGVERLAHVDRPLLERHLAWVMSGSGGPGVKKKIGRA